MIKIDQIDYHRNGVAGEGFHAVLFRERGKKFLATVFKERGQCAVICLDLIPTDGVTFGVNSWRGDHYETRLRNAIAAHWEAYDRERGIVA